MKVRRKWVKFLLIALSLFIVIKAYFEIDAYNYKTKIERITKMELEENRIKASVEHKVLDLTDCKIHYYVSGDKDKELIVFLHPAFSDHRAFKKQIDFFSENYRVITIDLIGHGLSKAKKSKDKIDASSKHIQNILEIEGVEKAHIVGVSLGSLIAQYFAYQFPDKILSLTALGGYSIHKESKEVEKAQRSANFGLIFRGVFSMNAFRKKAATLTCKSEKGQALFFEAASHFERKTFLVMQGLQNIIKDRKTTHPNYPLFILTGEFDIDLAKKMGEKWHAEIDNSSYLMIEGAGHCANMDKPSQFNKAVIEFIETKGT